MVPLGRRLLREACAQVQRWREWFGIDLSLSVNLSVSELGQPDLIEAVTAALADAGARARHAVPRDHRARADDRGVALPREPRGARRARRPPRARRLRHRLLLARLPAPAADRHPQDRPRVHDRRRAGAGRRRRSSRRSSASPARSGCGPWPRGSRPRRSGPSSSGSAASSRRATCSAARCPPPSSARCSPNHAGSGTARSNRVGPMNGRRAQAARNDTAILEAARAVYAADPDAPIASVATRAGVGISALYRRYPSKEELLRKLCGDGLKEYIAAAEEALADDGDAWKVFRRFTLRIVEADAHTLTSRLAARSSRTRRRCSATRPRHRTSASACSSARRRPAPCAPTRWRRTWPTCSSSSPRSTARRQADRAAAQALPDAAARRAAPAQEGTDAPRPAAAVERPAERVNAAAVPGNLSARLGSALSLMSEATLVLDEHGAVVAANDLAQEMFGYGEAAMSGKPVATLMPLAMPLGEVQEEGGPPRRMKLEGRRANGVPFPVEASVRWIDADEKTQVLCAVRELRYGALVTEAQRYFDAAFDHSPVGMALFNSDGEYVRVNDALAELLGRSGGAAARAPRSGVHASRGPPGRRRRRLGDPQRPRQHAPDREALRPPRRLGALGARQPDLPARRRRPAAELGRPVPRHHRAPRAGGGAAPHGRPRRADRAAQPARVPPGARAAHRARAPLRRGGRDPHARPRGRQARQRHARPPGGRRADRGCAETLCARATCSRGSAATSDARCCSPRSSPTRSWPRCASAASRRSRCRRAWR